MKNEEISHLTKQKLASALRRRLQNSRLEKISVTDLLGDCDISRPTFYYHFRNVYDLAMWVVEQDVFTLVSDGTECPSLEGGIRKMFEYIAANKRMFVNLSRSLGFDEFKSLFFSSARGMTLHFIAIMDKGIGARKEHMEFIADFYTHAFIGWVFQWIDEGMVETPEAMVRKLAIVMDGTIQESLRRSAESS